MISVLTFLHVFYEVTKLGEDEFLAGEFTGFKASRHAKDKRVANKACCGSGEQCSRVDLFETEISKKGTKGSQFLCEHWSDRLNGNISRPDACAACHEDRMRMMFLNDCADGVSDETLIVRGALMKHDVMPLFLGAFLNPVTALVIGKTASRRDRKDSKFQRLRGVGFVLSGAHARIRSRIVCFRLAVGIFHKGQKVVHTFLKLCLWPQSSVFRFAAYALRTVQLLCFLLLTPDT